MIYFFLLMGIGALLLLFDISGTLSGSFLVHKKILDLLESEILDLEEDEDDDGEGVLF